MKRLKSRGSSRAAADPEASIYGTQANHPQTRRRGLFDSFRKSNNNNNNNNNSNINSHNNNHTKVQEEDERMLLKKGSYTHSERTEPTDAMTYMSETMSVASEEISTALNKTFAILNTPSFTQSGQEIQFASASASFSTPRRNDQEGHFTNVGGGSVYSSQSGMLSQGNLDRLAAIETAANFSDPKKKQLRTQSLKVIEFHTDSPSCDIEEIAPTEVSAATFDPDKYLMEAEARQNSLEASNQLRQEDSKEEKEMVEVDMEEGVRVEREANQQSEHHVSTNMFDPRSAATNTFDTRIVVTGARTQSPNEEYISDASSDDDDDEEEVVVEKGTTSQSVSSPLNSVTSSGSTASSDWGKASFGTREASLLDAVFDPTQEHEEVDDDATDGTDDDDDHDDASHSTIDLDEDDGAGSVYGDGAVEEPFSPQSQSSSVIIDEYDEIDGLAAFAGIFLNLVSCNFTDLAANVLIDDEDEYSVVVDEHNQMAAADTNQPLPNRQPAADPETALPAPSLTTSLFSSFFGSCS